MSNVVMISQLSHSNRTKRLLSLADDIDITPNNPSGHFIKNQLKQWILLTLKKWVMVRIVRQLMLVGQNNQWTIANGKQDYVTLDAQTGKVT